LQNNSLKIIIALLYSLQYLELLVYLQVGKRLEWF